MLLLLAPWRKKATASKKQAQATQLTISCLFAFIASILCITPLLPKEEWICSVPRRREAASGWWWGKLSSGSAAAQQELCPALLHAPVPEPAMKMVCPWLVLQGNADQIQHQQPLGICSLTASLVATCCSFTFNPQAWGGFLLLFSLNLGLNFQILLCVTDLYLISNHPAKITALQQLHRRSCRRYPMSH